MMAYPGMCYAAAVDWLTAQTATDNPQVDDEHQQAVTDCLIEMGVPAGWLQMYRHRDIGDLVYQTYVDGWLRAERTELEWLTSCLTRLRVFTQAGTPWGVAAWHVLVGLVQERYGDATMIVWVCDE
jgi:hypothetical protein